MAMHDRIVSDSKIMLGKPIIRGTRISVELVLRKFSEGANEQSIVDAYPHLKIEDIRAAALYAADTIAHNEIVLRSSQS